LNLDGGVTGPRRPSKPRAGRPCHSCDPQRTALLGRDGPANHGRDARATLAILNEQHYWAETAQQTTGGTPVPLLRSSTNSITGPRRPSKPRAGRPCHSCDPHDTPVPHIVPTAYSPG
jgi:hypothetical protein